METPLKSNSVIQSAWDIVLGIITFTVIGVKDVIKFDVRGLVGPSAYDGLNDLGKRMILHGGTQRISDRAAIGRDKVTGQSASPAEKHAAMAGLVQHYATGGGWELAGGGLPPINRPALYQAVATIRKAKPEDVERVYRDKTDDVLRTLLTIPAIAGKYTELSRQGATPNEKAEALLKELGNAK